MRRKVLSQSSYVHLNSLSLLWDRRCSCNRAGRLNAFVHPSNGHRWVFSSDGYLADLVDDGDRGVAGVSCGVSLLALEASDGI